MTSARVPALRSERLRLDPFTLDDAAFALALLNEPSFLRFIGDKGVRTLDDARDYLADGPLASYSRHGHGLLRVALAPDGPTVGMCGLLRRDSCPDPDLGFAFLPAYWGRGYALEAAQTVLAHGRDALQLVRVVAFTAPDNERSAHLLEELGMRFEQLTRLEDGSECRRFGIELHDPSRG